jgi:glycerol-3-phosphate acyltransferase PlsY
MLWLFIFCVSSYLLGSIPTSVWVGKWFYNIDVREHGSKNAGATNTLRVLGAKAAIPVFIFDVFKGFIFAFIAHFHLRSFPVTIDTYLFPIIIGFCAVIGHIYPLYAGFRGGKGVATLLGMTLGIATIPSLLSFAVFIIVFIASKYVSLGSLSAGLLFPVFTFLFEDYSLSLILFSVFAVLLLFYTHRKNIKRLLNGTETKTTFKMKTESMES